MSRTISILICIILLCQVVSCSGNNTSPLSDSTCSAPCWREINMGATKEEVISELEKMSDVDKETIKTERIDRPYFEEEVHWHFNSGAEVGNILLNQNKVLAMYFPLKKQRSLLSLIEIYGQPDSIIIKKEKLDNIYIKAYILYQEKGVCLVHQPSLLPFIDPQSYKIRSSIPISEVYYADNTIPDWQINFGCEGGFDEDEYSKLLQNWKGYGEYTILAESQE